MSIFQNIRRNGFGDAQTGGRIATAISGAKKPSNGFNSGEQKTVRPGGGLSYSPAPPPANGQGPAAPAAQSAPVTGDVPMQTSAATGAAPAASAPRTNTGGGAVSDRVDAIIAKDSALMQRAATQGFQMANRRGLSNSSMAAGEAQNRVLDAAVPIATADAGDRLQRDLTRDELDSRLELTNLNNKTSIETANIGASASLGVAGISAATQKELAAINNRHDLTMQEKDALSREALAKLGFAHESGLADRDIAARRDIANLEVESRKDITGMQLDAAAEEGALNRAFQGDQQLQEIASRMDLANLDAETRTRIATTQIEAEGAQRNLDRALQQNLSDQQIQAAREDLDVKIAAAEREKLAAIIADANNQRMAATSNTLNNADIPAATRTAAQNSINDQYQQTINYAQNLYGVKLDDSTPTRAA